MPARYVRAYAQTTAAFVFAMCLAVLPILFGAVVAMSWTQRAFFPAQVEFTVDRPIVREPNGDVVLSGSFRKKYSELLCEYHSIRWYMPTFDASGEPMNLRVDATYADARREKRENDRPEGLNYFYGWHIETSEYPRLNILRGHVKHICFGIIPTRTDMPKINLPEFEKPDGTRV